MLSQSPERWIAWVRLVLVQDGGLSYDDAEDGVTCILLSYHRRTGDYPWKETKPDVLLQAPIRIACPIAVTVAVLGGDPRMNRGWAGSFSRYLVPNLHGTPQAGGKRERTC